MNQQDESFPGITARDDLRGWWWPDSDPKAVTGHAFISKGLKGLDQLIAMSDKSKVCIQAGGHVGMFPRKLAMNFKCVYTFEPEPKLFACMMRNCANVSNLNMYGAALSDSTNPVKLKLHPSAGRAKVSDEGTETVACMTIDALDLDDLGAIQLDVEGYEVQALRGGAATIRKCKPVIQVELLPNFAQSIDAYLREIGYKKKMVVSSRDTIYVPA